MKSIRNIMAFARSGYRPTSAITQKSFCSQYNDNNVIKSQISSVKIPNSNLHEFLLDKVDRWPEKTAVICSSTGRSYTFAQSDKLSSNLAQALCAKFGFTKGDVIAIMLPNVPEYIITYLGLFKAGIIVTTISPLYTPGRPIIVGGAFITVAELKMIRAEFISRLPDSENEIARQMKDSQAKAVITLASNYSTIENGINKLKNKIHIPVITIKISANDSTPSGAIDFQELCAYNGPQARLDQPTLEDMCVIAYSSGTSGLPKGVKLLHRNIVADLAQLQHELINLNHETTSSHQDTIPLVPPLFHAYGMIPILFNMFSQGGKCVTLPNYRPDLFLDLLDKYPGQIMYLVPPILLMLTNNEQATKKHLDQMRHVVSAAAPLAASDIERFNEKFGQQITVSQLYGLTETGPATHAHRQDKPVTSGSIGWLLPLTECKIVSVEDETRSLGANESGHMLLRGPIIMDGYLNNVKATQEAIDEDGWFRSGDICYYDEEGQFFVTDRIKELIKVKGFQVAPAELEALIREHPDVDDVAVIGIKHEQNGEAPRALVVPRKGSNLKTQEVKDFVNEKVAKYKQLHGGVSFVESIPKTAAGKILRRLLKDH